MSFRDVEWRLGRKLGRTIYAVRPGMNRGRDLILGMVDSVEIARVIVTEHNYILETNGMIGPERVGPV